MDTPDTSTVVLSGTTLALLIKEAFAWVRSRSQKTEIAPSPLPVEATPKGPFVTCGECKQHRTAIGKRIDTIEQTSHTILNKLDDLDTRAETRSENLHRRLDPIIEKVAANSAKVEAFEKAALAASKR